jgi:hypothetical protein
MVGHILGNPSRGLGAKPHVPSRCMGMAYTLGVIYSAQRKGRRLGASGRVIRAYLRGSLLHSIIAAPASSLDIKAAYTIIGVTEYTSIMAHKPFSRLGSYHDHDYDVHQHWKRRYCTCS